MRMARTMKAAGLYGVGDIRVTDIPRPSPGAGEILIKVEAATTCGTDLKMYTRGNYPGVELPFIPWGHESAGIVAEVGAGVNTFREGDKITAHNTAPCFHCFYCKKERYELCENLLHRWGAYAEYAIIPAPIVETNTFKIPDHISFAEAAIIEPLASAVHGSAEANIGVGDRVAIIGAGAQGLFHIQLARLYGADKIISIDVIDYRLNLAKELGATATVNAKAGNVEEKVRELTGGRGCDVVIEAVGKPETWEQAISLARKGGTVVEYGGCLPGTTMTVDTRKLHYEELNIKGTHHTTPGYVQKTWDLITSGQIRLKPIITREMNLGDIAEAYKILSGSGNEIKIAIIP
jgi:L-iditol 2-dehydrogenase